MNLFRILINLEILLIFYVYLHYRFLDFYLFRILKNIEILFILYFYSNRK